MRPCALLDVNVLLALGWRHHEHHDDVVSWHRSWLPRAWAVCPLTESGFIRVSMNPVFSGAEVSALLMRDALQRFSTRPGYERIPSIPDPADRRLDSLWSRLQGCRQVTDALLLATSIVEDCHLATIDGGIEGLSDVEGRVIRIVPE